MNDLAYFDFRDHLADDLRRGHVTGDFCSLFARTRDCAGVDEATAGRWAERFCRDLARHLEPKLTRAQPATSTPPRRPAL